MTLAMLSRKRYKIQDLANYIGSLISGCSAVL